MHTLVTTTGEKVVDTELIHILSTTLRRDFACFVKPNFDGNRLESRPPSETEVCEGFEMHDNPWDWLPLEVKVQSTVSGWNGLSETDGLGLAIGAV